MNRAFFYPSMLTRLTIAGDTACRGFMVIIFFLLGAGNLFAWDITGTIITGGDPGELLIYLVTEEDMRTPGTGYAHCRVFPESGSFRVRYRFRDIPEGVYGIRIFQDINGDGKVKRTPTGPAEPWALSWAGEKRRIPRFKDISFFLDRNLELNFTLEIPGE